ncbi:MAG: thiol reductant ABC exporter subunit CydC [Spirochaetales bacterium]|nr:thiol reductant ABC exporter subunit CydC [Spirochaetales bacterium]
MHSRKSPVRFLLRTARPFSGLLSVTVIMGIIGNLAGIFLTVSAALLAVSYLGAPFQSAEGSRTALWILFGASGALRGILRYIEQITGHDVAFRLLADLRSRIFDKLRELGPGRLNEKRSGDLVSLIMGDIELIEVFFAHTVAPVLIAFFCTLTVLVFYGTLHPALVPVMLVFFVMVGVVVPMINYRIGKGTGQEYRNLLSDTNAFFLDRILGIRDIILLGQQKAMREGVEKRSRELAAKTESLRKKEAAVGGITETLIILSIISVLGLSVTLMQKGEISAQGVVVAVVTAFSSFGPLLALSNLSLDLIQTLASGERLEALLDEEPSVKDNGTDDLPAGSFRSLEIKNINFTYPGTEKQILDAFNMTLNRGETLALAGESGAGKSTLFRLLQRYYNPSGGEILINGIPVQDIPLSLLRDLCAVVSQDTFLFNESVAWNIGLGKEGASMDEIVEAAKMANIHDLISSLPAGYDTPVGELGENFSSGERQRLSIARALLKDADLILLDEPTSHLDNRNEMEILQTIKSAFSDKTVLIISHRRDAVEWADRIIEAG